MRKGISAASFRIIVQYLIFAASWSLVSHYLIDVVSDYWSHYLIDVADDVALAVLTVLLLYFLLRREQRKSEAVEILRSQGEAERLRLQARMAAEQQVFQHVFNAMADGVIVWDENGVVREANPAALALLGFEPKGLTPPELAERRALVWPDGRALGPEELPSVRAQSGSIVKNEPVTLGNDSGQELKVLVTASPLRIGQNLAGVVTVLHDVTEREELLAKLEQRVQERTASLTETANRLREATEELARSNELLEQRVEERTRELYREAQRTAALEERQRLARELHDSVSQALYGIALGVHAALEMQGKQEKRITETLNYVLGLAQSGLTEMRALIFELRPDSLERQGLVAALTTQALAVQARYGIEVQMDLGDEPEIPPEAKESLYRVAQQALHNIVQHARASHARLCLCYRSDNVVLEVCDDGVGFDPHAPHRDSLGLRSMRERTERLGGRLDIESVQGGGTLIRAQIPLAGSPG